MGNKQPYTINRIAILTLRTGRYGLFSGITLIRKGNLQGRLEHGFLRVQCDTCYAEHLVAFSCKRRGFCPSCGARRMVESAALLVDEVLPLLECSSIFSWSTLIFSPEVMRQASELAGN